MKKTITILLSVLAAIFLVLSAINWRGSYDAERELWGLNRDLVKMSYQQESTPEYAVEKLADRYRAFIKTYPKSPFTMRAQFTMGNLYLFKKNYTKARAEFLKALSVYPKDKELMAETEAAVGKTYEYENNWPKAVAIYKQLSHDYPLTATGFGAPEYIARYYKANGLKNEANNAYEKAVLFYKNMAAKNPKSRIEYSALKMMAVCRLSQERWNDAVQDMYLLMMKYPSGLILEETLKGINEICITKLHNYDEAIGYYRQFINKYPKHPAIPVIKKLISGLQLLKGKGIIITTNPKTLTN